MKKLNLYVTDETYTGKDDKIKDLPVVSSLNYDEIHIVGGDPLTKYGRLYNFLTNLNEITPELYGIKPNVYIHTSIWRIPILVCLSEVCNVLSISLNDKDDIGQLIELNRELNIDTSDVFYHFRRISVNVFIKEELFPNIDINPILNIHIGKDNLGSSSDNRRIVELW